MSDPYRTTYHRDGTVTYWSVYNQIWTRCAASEISDLTLGNLSHAERARIARMIDAEGDRVLRDRHST